MNSLIVLIYLLESCSSGTAVIKILTPAVNPVDLNLGDFSYAA